MKPDDFTRSPVFVGSLVFSMVLVIESAIAWLLQQ